MNKDEEKMKKTKTHTHRRKTKAKNITKMVNVTKGDDDDFGPLTVFNVRTDDRHCGFRPLQH